MVFCWLSDRRHIVRRGDGPLHGPRHERIAATHRTNDPRSLRVFLYLALGNRRDLIDPRIENDLSLCGAIAAPARSGDAVTAHEAPLLPPATHFVFSLSSPFPP